MLNKSASKKKNCAPEGIVHTPNVSHKREVHAHLHFAIMLKRSIAICRGCLVDQSFDLAKIS